MYVYTLQRGTTKLGVETRGKGRVYGSVTPSHIAQMSRAVCQR